MFYNYILSLHIAVLSLAFSSASIGMHFEVFLKAVIYVYFLFEFSFLLLFNVGFPIIVIYRICLLGSFVETRSSSGDAFLGQPQFSINFLYYFSRLFSRHFYVFLIFPHYFIIIM